MTRKHSSPLGLELLVSITLAFIFLPLTTNAAPLQDYTEIQQYSEGCYYNYNHYGEGDRILTNEPCLNCTCHNRMLMCYLRVCPFTKPIGHDCIVEKREDQCCPIITCPEVPVDVAHHAPEPGTELSIPEKFGCSIDDKFYPEGAQVPSNPNKPCELCYCIKNRTSCLMQECTLHIDGCTPIYNKGSCCPVRYNCDHENDVLELEDLSTTTTTIRPTPGFVLTTTMTPAVSSECIHNGNVYADGASILGKSPCEHCYCMRGDIVCAVQECEMPLLAANGKSCKAVPPAENECCPSNYICEDDSVTTLASTDEINDLVTTTSAPTTMKDPLTSILEEDMQLQTHIDEDDKNIVPTDHTEQPVTQTATDKFATGVEAGEEVDLNREPVDSTVASTALDIIETTTDGATAAEKVDKETEEEDETTTRLVDENNLEVNTVPSDLQDNDDEKSGETKEQEATTVTSKSETLTTISSITVDNTEKPDLATSTESDTVSAETQSPKGEFTEISTNQPILVSSDEEHYITTEAGTAEKTEDTKTEDTVTTAPLAPFTELVQTEDAKDDTEHLLNSTETPIIQLDVSPNELGAAPDQSEEIEVTTVKSLSSDKSEVISEIDQGKLEVSPTEMGAVPDHSEEIEVTTVNSLSSDKSDEIADNDQGILDVSPTELGANPDHSEEIEVTTVYSLSSDKSDEVADNDQGKLDVSPNELGAIPDQTEGVEVTTVNSLTSDKSDEVADNDQGKLDVSPNELGAIPDQTEDVEVTTVNSLSSDKSEEIADKDQGKLDVRPTEMGAIPDQSEEIELTTVNALSSHKSEEVSDKDQGKYTTTSPSSDNDMLGEDEDNATTISSVDKKSEEAILGPGTDRVLSDSETPEVSNEGAFITTTTVESSTTAETISKDENVLSPTTIPTDIISENLDDKHVEASGDDHFEASGAEPIEAGAPETEDEVDDEKDETETTPGAEASDFTTPAVSGIKDVTQAPSTNNENLESTEEDNKDFISTDVTTESAESEKHIETETTTILEGLLTSTTSATGLQDNLTSLPIEEQKTEQEPQDYIAEITTQSTLVNVLDETTKLNVDDAHPSQFAVTSISPQSTAETTLSPAATELNNRHDFITEDQSDVSDEEKTTTSPKLVVEPSEKLPEMYLPPVIPGEGDCLVNMKTTYQNNSIVPTSNKCELECRCISSVVICDRVKCVEPTNVENCVLVENSEPSCCPTYTCEPMPSSDEDYSTTTLPSKNRIENDEDKTIAITDHVPTEISMPEASTAESMSHIKDDIFVDSSTKETIDIIENVTDGPESVQTTQIIMASTPSEDQKKKESNAETVGIEPVSIEEVNSSEEEKMTVTDRITTVAPVREEEQFKKELSTNATPLDSVTIAPLSNEEVSIPEGSGTTDKQDEVFESHTPVFTTEGPEHEESDIASERPEDQLTVISTKRPETEQTIAPTESQDVKDEISAQTTVSSIEEENKEQEESDENSIPTTVISKDDENKKSEGEDSVHKPIPLFEDSEATTLTIESEKETITEATALTDDKLVDTNVDKKDHNVEMEIATTDATSDAHESEIEVVGQMTLPTVDKLLDSNVDKEDHTDKIDNVTSDDTSGAENEEEIESPTDIPTAALDADDQKILDKNTEDTTLGPLVESTEVTLQGTGTTPTEDKEIVTTVVNPVEEVHAPTMVPEQPDEDTNSISTTPSSTELVDNLTIRPLSEVSIPVSEDAVENETTTIQALDAEKETDNDITQQHSTPAIEKENTSDENITVSTEESTDSHTNAPSTQEDSGKQDKSSTMGPSSDVENDTEGPSVDSGSDIGSEDKFAAPSITSDKEEIGQEFSTTVLPLFDETPDKSNEEETPIEDYKTTTVLPTAEDKLQLGNTTTVDSNDYEHKEPSEEMQSQTEITQFDGEVTTQADKNYELTGSEEEKEGMHKYISTTISTLSEQDTGTTMEDEKSVEDTVFTTVNPKLDEPIVDISSQTVEPVISENKIPFDEAMSHKVESSSNQPTTVTLPTDQNTEEEGTTRPQNELSQPDDKELSPSGIKNETTFDDNKDKDILNAEISTAIPSSMDEEKEIVGNELTATISPTLEHENEINVQEQSIDQTTVPTFEEGGIEKEINDYQTSTTIAPSDEIKKSDMITTAKPTDISIDEENTTAVPIVEEENIAETTNQPFIEREKDTFAQTTAPTLDNESESSGDKKELDEEEIGESVTTAAAPTVSTGIEKEESTEAVILQTSEIEGENTEATLAHTQIPIVSDELTTDSSSDQEKTSGEDAISPNVSTEIEDDVQTSAPTTQSNVPSSTDSDKVDQKQTTISPALDTDMDTEYSEEDKTSSQDVNVNDLQKPTEVTNVTPSITTDADKESEAATTPIVTSSEKEEHTTSLPVETNKTISDDDVSETVGSEISLVAQTAAPTFNQNTMDLTTLATVTSIGEGNKTDTQESATTIVPPLQTTVVDKFSVESDQDSSVTSGEPSLETITTVSPLVSSDSIEEDASSQTIAPLSNTRPTSAQSITAGLDSIEETDESIESEEEVTDKITVPELDENITQRVEESTTQRIHKTDLDVPASSEEQTVFSNEESLATTVQPIIMDELTTGPIKTEEQIKFETDKEFESSTEKKPTLNENITGKPEAVHTQTATDLPTMAGEDQIMSTTPNAATNDSGSNDLEDIVANQDVEISDNTTLYPKLQQESMTTTLPSTTANIENRVDTETTTASTTVDMLSTTTKTTTHPITTAAPVTHYPPPPPMYGQQPYPTYSEDEYTDEDETEVFGPGTCRYGGKLYVSAQQIPRDDPCDFCFCFRSDIICLQQSCPPPISGCHEEPISGFCCPRYECPVSMAAVLNITTSTTTTSTTLPPHFLHHTYGDAVQRNGCFINGRSYRVGEKIESTSGPCINCTCGDNGKMKCDPQACVPEPTMQQVMAVVAAGRKR